MTEQSPQGDEENGDFNPHEREARDGASAAARRRRKILIHTSVKLVTYRFTDYRPSRFDFNPHEREARDTIETAPIEMISILIHTSVKLVTGGVVEEAVAGDILIHTSVKLVTQRAQMEPRPHQF